MIKVLFVCHGNICRSPMAEFMLKDMAEKTGLSDLLSVSSAATTYEEIGNPVYPPAKQKLAEHGIGCEGKTARKLVFDDYFDNDLIIGMDRENMYDCRRLFGGDPVGKLHTMMEYAGRDGEEVPDPWYTRNFEYTWLALYQCCLGLLNGINGDEPVHLDFSECVSKKDLYAVMRKKMLWQDFYGENLDALWDILTGLPYFGVNFTVTMPDDEDLFPYASDICDVFLDAGVSIESTDFEE